MPTYEYVCDKCGKQFALTMTISEHEGKKVQCPECNSEEVSRHYSSVMVKTSKKS
ncbi:MAG: zinc ribbon domain-containing protein [Acidobacteriota bacterium]